MTGLRRLLATWLLGVNRLIAQTVPESVISRRSALVFAPHPDDEVLGCGGVIALKARAGTPVKVVVMTDGRTSHAKHIEAGELVRMRRAEAEEAGRRLGIPECYEFLDFEDHRLSQSSDAACARVAELVRTFAPQEIYVPHRPDQISDHVETNRIVRCALAQVGRPVVLLEYPVWLWNAWPWTPNLYRHDGGVVRRASAVLLDILAIVIACRTRCEISDCVDAKRAALAAYRSQVERVDDNPRWAVLGDVSSGEFLRCFERSEEVFQRTEYRP